MMKNLVLVSPFNPEAGFDVGNAMARNKYIYCLSDAAIVVATSKGSGGTWSGATENLKRNWAPLWVLNHLTTVQEMRHWFTWAPDGCRMTALWPARCLIEPWFLFQPEMLRQA
jgi:hypothetical protein